MMLLSSLRYVPIDAQGIEFDIEKKAVCFEKKKGRAEGISFASPATMVMAVFAYVFLAASSAKNSVRWRTP